MDTGFDWKQPRLLDCRLAEAAKAKELTNIIIDYTLVPMISKGSETMPLVGRICSALRKSLEKHHVTNALLEAALIDIKMCLDYLHQLSSDTATVDIKTLDAVGRAKSGPKCLVKRAVLQQKAWSRKEQDIRQLEVARATLGPKLEELSTALANEPSLGVVEETVEQLPRFRDRLGAGASAESPCVNKETMSFNRPIKLKNASVFCVLVKQVLFRCSEHHDSVLPPPTRDPSFLWASHCSASLYSKVEGPGQDSITMSRESITVC